MELEPAHIGNSHVDAKEERNTNNAQIVGNAASMVCFTKVSEADDAKQQHDHQADTEPEPEFSSPSSIKSQESMLASTGSQETEVVIEQVPVALLGRPGKSAADEFDEIEEVDQVNRIMNYDTSAAQDSTDNFDNAQIHHIDLSEVENSSPESGQEVGVSSPSSTASSSSTDSSSLGDSSNSSSSNSSNSASDSDSDSSVSESELGLLESEPGNPPLFSPLWHWALEPIHESTEDMDYAVRILAAESEAEPQMMLKAQNSSSVQDMNDTASILAAPSRAEPETMLMLQSNSSVHEGEEVDRVQEVTCSVASKLDAHRVESEREPEMMLRAHSSSSVQHGEAVACERSAEGAGKLDAHGAESKAELEMLLRVQSSSSVQDRDRRPNAKQVACSAACKLDSKAEPEMMLRAQRSLSMQDGDEVVREFNAEQVACSAACKFDAHRPVLKAVQFEKPGRLVASEGAERIKGELAVDNENLSQPWEALNVSPHTSQPKVEPAVCNKKLSQTCETSNATPHTAQRKVEQALGTKQLSQPLEPLSVVVNLNLSAVPCISQLPFPTSSSDASHFSDRSQHFASYNHESVTAKIDAVESQGNPTDAQVSHCKDGAIHSVQGKLLSVKPKTPRKPSLAGSPCSPRDLILPKTPPLRTTPGAYSPSRSSRARGKIWAKTPRSATPGACFSPQRSQIRSKVMARTPRSVRSSLQSSETENFCFDELQNMPAIRFPSRSVSVAEQSSWPWSLWPSIFCTCTPDNAILLEEEMPF